MAIKFELEADVRSDLGKGASRRLRQTNKVPAVMYGADKEIVALTLDHDKVWIALNHEAFYSHILTMKVGKKADKVVLKDVQRQPGRSRILHMDFLRIDENAKLEMHIPLHFEGETDAPGVKDGGIVNRTMSDLLVSCLPADLPEYIEVDISHLGIGDAIHLSELKLPKGVEVAAFVHGRTDERDLPVVAIHMPRAEVVEETAAPVSAEVPATQQLAPEAQAAADAAKGGAAKPAEKAKK